MGLPLQVFILGLLTVFFVLMVVMAGGKAIIWFVNSFLATTLPGITDKPSDPPPERKKQTAAIVAAVQSITGGQARSVKIEKL